MSWLVALLWCLATYFPSTMLLEFAASYSLPVNFLLIQSGTCMENQKTDSIKHNILIFGIRTFNYLGEGRQRLLLGAKNWQIFDLFAKYLVFYDLEIEGAFFFRGEGERFLTRRKKVKKREKFAFVYYS